MNCGKRMQPLSGQRNVEMLSIYGKKRTSIQAIRPGSCLKKEVNVTTDQKMSLSEEGHAVVYLKEIVISGLALFQY